MAANVETMMYVREKPWHGLGVEVSEAPNSEDALRFAGLDWNVRQENVFNSRGGIIKGFKANVRVPDFWYFTEMTVHLHQLRKIQTSQSFQLCLKAYIMK